MSRDTLSDLLRSVRLRGAAFFYISFRDQWSAEGLAAKEVAHAVMPGCEHVMEYHMMAKGSGWAAVSGEPPIRLGAGDIVMFPQGDRHVISSAPGMAPHPASAEWIYSVRNDPKPLPMAFYEGKRVPGETMRVEEADSILVCGFLGCDVRPFNPLVSALPRVLHLPASRAGDWVERVIDQAVAESWRRSRARTSFGNDVRRCRAPLSRQSTGGRDRLARGLARSFRRQGDRAHARASRPRVEHRRAWR
jgi:hypothetical protein